MTTSRARTRGVPTTSAVALVAVVALALAGTGCARGEDPKAAVTGQQNIGSATPATTAPRSASTTRSATTTPAGSTPGTAPRVAKPNAVDINDYSFLPVELHVPVGTTVTWTNSEADPPVDHYVKTAPGQAGDIDSGELPPGQSSNKTFAAAGTFPYYCQIHNFMKASVVVQ